MSEAMQAFLAWWFWFSLVVVVFIIDAGNACQRQRDQARKERDNARSELWRQRRKG